MEDFIVSTVFDGKRRRLYRTICDGCGRDFYAPKHTKRKFCSQTCYGISNEPKLFDLRCAFCGIGFSRTASFLKKSKSGLRFCCRRCKDSAQRIGSNVPEICPPHYGTGEGSYRDIAYRHHPRKCNRCGFDEHVEILTVHHRDRNKSNNNPKNLEVLCPNCHDWEHFTHKDGNYSGGGGRKKTVSGL